jgi:hypothetical protein
MHIRTTEEMLNEVCRNIRREPSAQQWLKEHPETRTVLATVRY